jgi:hypothetical protein
MSLASRVSGTPGVLQSVEFTMPEREPARRADFLDLLSQAMHGVFPGPMLEALIARLEVAR